MTHSLGRGSLSAGCLLGTVLGLATVTPQTRAQVAGAGALVESSSPKGDFTKGAPESPTGITQFKPRLVVTGLDDHGRSSFVFDGAIKSTQRLATSTLVTLWQVARIPTSMTAESDKTEPNRFMPPPEGFRAVMVELKPDSIIGDDAARRRAFAKVLEDVGETNAKRSAGPPGMHQTDTCDLVTIISGQVYAVLETGEKLLRPGDTLIQRGTSHAWSNRSKTPAVFLYVVWPAQPSADKSNAHPTN